MSFQKYKRYLLLNHSGWLVGGSFPDPFEQKKHAHVTVVKLGIRFLKVRQGKNIYKNHQKSIVGASPASDFLGGNVAVGGVK